MKVPNSLPRRLNIRLIIYLDDMLIMARSVQDLIFHRDTVIYLLQNLGFVLNLKSVLEPSKKIEFLGMVLDSIKMEISLPQEKLVILMSQCKQVAEQRDYHHGLNKVNRAYRINCPSNTACTTSSSVLATFANPGIKTFEMLSCQSTFRQGYKGRTFLVDRKFKALQRKSLILPPADLCMSTDASTKGWGPHVKGYQQADHGHRRNRKLTSTY